MGLWVVSISLSRAGAGGGGRAPRAPSGACLATRRVSRRESRHETQERPDGLYSPLTTRADTPTRDDEREREALLHRAPSL